MKITTFADGKLQLILQAELQRTLNGGCTANGSLTLDCGEHVLYPQSPITGEIDVAGRVQTYSLLCPVLSGQMVLQRFSTFFAAEQVPDAVTVTANIQLDAELSGTFVGEGTVQETLDTPPYGSRGRAFVTGSPMAFDDIKIQIDNDDILCTHRISLYVDEALVAGPKTTAAGVSTLTFYSGEYASDFGRITREVTEADLQVRCETFLNGHQTAPALHTAYRLQIIESSDTAPLMQPFTAIISEGEALSGRCTATLTLSDPGGVTGQRGAYIASFEADFAGRKFTVPYSAAGPLVMSCPDFAGGDITLVAIDSRGFRTARTFSLPLKAYLPPDITLLQVEHGAAIPTLQLRANWYEGEVDGSPNRLSAHITLQRAGFDPSPMQYTLHDLMSSGSVASLQWELPADLSLDTPYILRAVLTDSAGGTDTAECWFSLPASLYGQSPLQRAYPVGSIYISVSDADPKDLFGFGTWEQIKDRFLLGVGSRSAGSTGGEEQHTLTVAEMPKHKHALRRPQWFGWDGTLGMSTQFSSDSGAIFGQSGLGNVYETAADWGDNGVAAGIISNGSDLPHNNMPPYLTVYMWQRIS